MFSDVAYHEHHHYNTPHLRPHPPENHLLGGFFDSLPSSPAGIPSRDLPYIYAHAQQIRQASVQPSRQYGLPVQRTNSYPCQESLRGTQARRLGGSEHMLRRKTPSGTLAAGYDGSPVDWASDTNDMKHSLGPLSSATNMYLAHQASPMGQGQYNPPAPSSSRFRSKAPREFDSLNYDRVGGSSEIDMGNMRLNWPQNHGYSPGIDSFLDQVPAHHGQVYFLSNGQQIPTVLQPTWQPCIGPTASNDPGPYGPYWPNGSFIPYRPAALRDPRYFPHPALGWASHYEDERAKYHEREQETRASALSMTSTWNEGLAHYSPFDLTGRPGQLAPSEYPFRQASRSYPSQKFEAKYKPVDVTRAHQTYSGYTTEHRTTGSTSRQIKHSQGNDSGYSTPFTPLGPYDTKQALIPDFSMQFDHSQCREKALSWAHRVYVDLLASLHQSRKASLHGRQSDRKRNLPQTNIYPRPPRQPGLDFSTQISDQNVQRNRDAQAESSYRIGCEEHVSKKPKQDYSANDYSASTTSHRRRTSISPCADSFEKPKATQQQEYSSPQNFTAPGYAASDLHNLRKSSMPGVSSNNCQNQLGSSPSTNAMAALELLTRLCQESGWLWIDGMLLGGCLAYGLGDYHKAAAWYSKILANDSR